GKFNLTFITVLVIWSAPAMLAQRRGRCVYASRRALRPNGRCLGGASDRRESTPVPGCEDYRHVWRGGPQRRASLTCPADAVSASPGPIRLAPQEGRAGGFA